MSGIPLEIFWYLIVGVAIVAYVILDGFDLGVGMWHLFPKKDDDRRIFLNAIGPVWDGNEVWLVIVGGALFAGFPEVYATLFSGFYDLCMLMLAALMFRATAIEFRSKRPSKLWRKTWDVAFSVASFIIAFSVGLILGNLIEGISLDANKNFVGSYAEFFRPYPVLIGLLSVSLMMMHGAVFLLMKTEGALQEKIRKYMKGSVIAFFALYVLVTVVTVSSLPHMTQKMKQYPILFVVALAALVCLLNIIREAHRKYYGRAFLSSSLGILLLMGVFGIGVYPTLVRSTVDPMEYSLTIFNAASSQLTLEVLSIMVAIGVPLVIGYSIYIYRVFKGKVKIGPGSY